MIPRRSIALASLWILSAATSVVVTLLTPLPARAQNAERISVDSVLGADIFRGENAASRPDLVVDIAISARVGRGWTGYIRPWFLQPKTTTWNKQIYQAALQYQHEGRVDTRVDLGYIASPFGLGMLDMRPGINANIAPHLSYLIPLTKFAPGPAVGAVAASYPFGGQVTASTTRWDARAALVNSTPTRVYVINGSANPHTTPALVVGGGITPKPGLRFGVSAAYGDYATDSELPTPEGRSVTMLAAEGEYAFGYTRLSGEVTHDRFETGSGHAPAYAWYVQGMQTLSPRWFVAARQEGMQAPPLMGAPLTITPSFLTAEGTVGYRVSNDVTLRASAFGRRAYMKTNWDRQFAMSVVWARRWW